MQSALITQIKIQSTESPSSIVTLHPILQATESLSFLARLHSREATVQPSSSREASPSSREVTRVKSLARSSSCDAPRATLLLETVQPFLARSCERPRANSLARPPLQKPSLLARTPSPVIPRSARASHPRATPRLPAIVPFASRLPIKA